MPPINDDVINDDVPTAPVSALDWLNEAALGKPPQIEPMPAPTVRARVPMRDGVRLDTWVWTPEDTAVAVPAILFRTPYHERLMGWKRMQVLRYRDAGYAVVYQLVRGVADSEGEFSFNAPHERTDGFDAVEWVAAQTWCDGAVGMDGPSYMGMTQLSAASAQPPHLRCIIVSAPSTDFFRERPHPGGALTRVDEINWTNLISIASLAELSGGFMGVMPILSKPDWLRRSLSRPVIDAADDVLSGDKLQHYRDVVAHATFDDWWAERTPGAADYERMTVPTLLVSGNFDDAVTGTLVAWRGLEANVSTDVERHLLLGPWDHGHAYAGGVSEHGPYSLGEEAVWDLVALRLAFFDEHLRGRDTSMRLPGRVSVFITGANQWRGFSEFPPASLEAKCLHLHSEGRANSARGDGTLTPEPPSGQEPVDTLVSDPELPFVATMAGADPALVLDLREAERCHERLVYSSEPLDEPITILGEPEATLWVEADCPDCDVVVWLAEHRADGRTVRLASGVLRLRFREGFDREVLLEPGVPVRIAIPLTYVAHEVPAGSRVRLMIGGDDYPYLDPNPNTGEPIATGVDVRVVTELVHHSADRPSYLQLPVLV